MSMTGDQWYLRTNDETFGPQSKSRLIEWARMGRIQPGQEISADRATWTAVTDVPWLEMRWSIDIGDGHPRGPFNKHAAQALLASGRLPPGSRLVESVPEPHPAEPPPQPEPEPPPPQPEPPPAAPPPEPPLKAELEAARQEIDRLHKELETFRSGMRGAETRAAEAESAVEQIREELKAAVKANDLAAARIGTLETELDAIRRSELEAKHEAENAMQKVSAAEASLAKAETDFSDLYSSAQASEQAYENRIKALSEELKRLPPTAQLAADAQAAMYALMKEEADELAATLEAEHREIEALRKCRRERAERLSARRQEILRRIGTDAEDMTRRALKAHPEDPRTTYLRQELDALRILQERTAAESEARIADLNAKLREREMEASRLREQSGDAALLYRQLQETREKLRTRERELTEERQRTDQERREQASTQQALLARLSELEVSLPGGTNQSREARSVRLAPWMGLKK